MTEVEQPPQNGIDLSAAEDDDNSKARPADIEQDMREMERRKRVEAIMSSKLFREELERIVDSAREGGSASGILQQLSDIVGMPASRVGSVFKSSNCMIPINDIRGVESMGYAKGEKILRCKLAATFRLLDLYGWNQGLGAQITARLKVDQEYFLVNPYGILYHEITASSLNKVDMQGHIVEQGTTNFGVNRSHFILHSVVHAARPDIRCAIYIGCSPVVAVSSLKTGLMPITKDACLLGEITTHPYSGTLLDTEERDKLVRNLGPNSKVLILANYGAICCGETIEEAFFAACHIVQACETQLKLLPVGLDNLVLIPEESRKIIYEQSRRPPEDLEKKFAALAATGPATAEVGGEHEDNNVAAVPTTVKIGSAPKWRVGGAEFEALMRMLDNAGYRTGYIYRHPLIKSDPPKPKNDVELPPAVSSLGYLLEEEELFRQGIWKKGDLRKGGDRSKWLNSPNVYQKVEVLETGTPDPKKITKWVAEGSPTHSTPVRIEDPLQFVPAGTNPKEFKRLQQQIKDNRRADKISAGPQSHILEGVTWDEANRIKDATVSSAGDHVVLMGAASKGIIQRGFQHNATVYKAPYAKNPFDNVTDDELNEYKRTVERKKKSIHGEYTDTDFSESEALSSLQTSGAQHTKQTTTTTAAVSQSEPEDVSEHQVMRIETLQAPVPSQPEVVLSDATLSFINGERSHTATNRKPPTGRVLHNDRHPSIHHHMHQHHLKMHKNHLNNIKTNINNLNFYKKYAFLYEDTNLFICNHFHANVNLFMIHKIEILPHYTYPLTMHNNNNNSDHQFHSLSTSNKPPQHAEEMMQQNHAIPIPTTPTLSIETISLSPSPRTAALTPPPYRTVSHYGFNYPLTYLPSIALHPANLLTAVELQRQKVIEFINSTVMSLDRELHDDAGAEEEVEPDDSRETPSKNLASKPKATEDPSPADCCNSSTTLKRDDNNGSFISVKEIQLEPKRKRRQQHRNCNDSTKAINANEDVNNNTFTAATSSADEHNNHEQDALSEEFSSLLSLGASYPAASHSLSGDLANEHDPEDENAHDEHHDDHHDIFDDSGDNSSTFTVPPAPPMRHAVATSSENIYRSYILRNFLPITGDGGGGNNHHSRRVAATYRDHNEHDIQHKPEAEQALHVDFKNSTAAGQQHGSQGEEYYTQHKQIKLTVNSLKRRASRDYGRREHHHDRHQQPHDDHHHQSHDRHHHQQHDHPRHITASVSEETASCSLSDSSSLKSLEIHINISIKNSDYAKNLQTHEQEFKMKLEKVINDELNLISQQLSAHNITAHRSRYDSNSSTLLHQHLARTQSQSGIDVDTRCANEPTRLTRTNTTGSAAADTETDSGVAHILQAPPPSSLASASASISSSFASLRHRHTLALLEHELENLLNGIIRANEMHNRAVMCDCKTKISQISDEIRTSLNVGKLN